MYSVGHRSGFEASLLAAPVGPQVRGTWRLDPTTVPREWCSRPSRFTADGVADGIWLFHRAGAVVEQREWRLGLPHGVWRSWDGGVTHHRAAFSNGQLVEGRWPVAHELTPPMPFTPASALSTQAHLVSAQWADTLCEPTRLERIFHDD